jgi:hypothetical protein
MTPAGMQPLSALRVEFGGGNFVTLTREALSMKATLRIPRISWLLDRVDAKKYQYKVVNIHGEMIGITSELRSGEGEGELIIEPATQV